MLWPPHNYHQTDRWSQEKTCIIHIFVERIFIFIFIINDEKDTTFYHHCFPHCQSSFWQMFCLGTGENWRSLGNNLESLKSHQALKSNCIHEDWGVSTIFSMLYMTISHIWTHKLKIISIALCVFVGHLNHPKGKLCSECYIAKVFWTLTLPKCQKYSGKSTTSERKSS